MASPNERLRAARVQKGLSQKQVADAIDTNRFTVARWELGLAIPRPYFRRKLCELFGLSEEKLGFAPGSSELEPPAGDARQGRISTTSATIPLPPLRDRLVGRQDLLTGIKGYLAEHTIAPAVAVHGLPGAGKTALAVELAYDPELQAHFPDGVLWAGLGPTPNVLAILGRWGEALGILPAYLEKLRTLEVMTTALRSTIGTRRMFLIVDDVWSIEDALALKVGGPASAHLVTTRFPLVAAQWSQHGAFVAQDLGERDGVEIVSQLAPEIVAAEQDRVKELVRSVGGLPLALTLIGKYLHLQALGGQSRRIHAALEHLRQADARLSLSMPYAPAERPPGLAPGAIFSLRTIIGLSETAFSLAASAALRAIAVFPAKPNSFSEEAALAVAGEEAEEAITWLDALVDAGLLETASSGRYMLHQAIAEYARLEGTSSEAEHRMARYFLQLVAMQPETAVQAIVDTDLQNLLVALDWASRVEPDEWYIRGVLACSKIMYSRGVQPEFEGHLQHAREAAQEADRPDLLIPVILQLGRMLEWMGKYAPAELLAREGLALSQETTDPKVTCRLYYLLGMTIGKRGDLTTALHIYERGEQFARRHRLPLVVTFMALIGGILETQGSERTSQYYEQALQLARDWQLTHEECTCLQNLGAHAGRHGEYERAIMFFSEGLQLARETGDRFSQCGLLNNLGQATSDQGNLDEAQLYFAEALELARQLHHPEMVCIILQALGDIERIQQRYDLAQHLLKEGLDIARSIGHAEFQIYNLLGLAKCAVLQGDLSPAEAYVADGLVLTGETLTHRLRCQLILIKGEIELARHDVPVATALFQEAIHLAEQHRDQETIAAALFGKARSALAEHALPEAMELARQSLLIYRAIQHRDAQEITAWMQIATAG